MQTKSFPSMRSPSSHPVAFVCSVDDVKEEEEEEEHRRSTCQEDVEEEKEEEAENEAALGGCKTGKRKTRKNSRKCWARIKSDKVTPMDWTTD